MRLKMEEMAQRLADLKMEEMAQRLADLEARLS